MQNFTPIGAIIAKIRMTTSLENMEMSGILLKVKEVSGKTSCQGKVA